MTPGSDVPFPEFIEQGYAPGRKVWLVRGDEGELYGGIVAADDSEDDAIRDFWVALRRWGYGLWGAVFDGDTGAVRCGWYVSASGREVVATYDYAGAKP